MTHSCFAKANKGLETYNTELDLVTAINIKAGEADLALVISTKRIQNLRDGKKPKKVFATYCPFCGEKL
jgi:hypothetical protein